MSDLFQENVEGVFTAHVVDRSGGVVATATIIESLDTFSPFLDGRPCGEAQPSFQDAVTTLKSQITSRGLRLARGAVTQTTLPAASVTEPPRPSAPKVRVPSFGMPLARGLFAGVALLAAVAVAGVWWFAGPASTKPDGDQLAKDATPAKAKRRATKTPPKVIIHKGGRKVGEMTLRELIAE